MERRQWTMRSNGDRTWTILEPNPDAGKSGVVYSGEYFAVVTSDSKEDSQLIAAAPEMYQLLKRIQALIASGDWQLPKGFCESEVNWLNSVISKIEWRGKVDGN